MFLQGKDFAHLKGLHNQIIWYQTHLDATHTYQSRPWQWFLNLRPVWFYVNHNPLGEGTTANIYAFGNPALFWFGDIAIVSTLFVVVRAAILKLLKTKQKVSVSWALTFTLVAYAMVWLPWIASPRIMFFYHYAPAVPLLCILLSYWLVKIDRSLAITALGIIGLCFIIWYPNWTALPVSTQFAEWVYFSIPSWK